MSVLDAIVSSTRRRLAAVPPVEGLRMQLAGELRGRQPHAFRSALASRKGSAIIAEIKAASPSAGRILADPDVPALATMYARAGAAAISVVTERDHFKGDPSWLAVAREHSGLPVLMKDFVIDERQILQAARDGADAVLLLASILETADLRRFIEMLDGLGMDALVEVHDDTELDRAVAAGAPIIGVNNRNLVDFSVTLEASLDLIPRVPSDRLRVSESGIRSKADIDTLADAGFDAFLIGTTLLSSDDPQATLRTMTGVLP